MLPPKASNCADIHHLQNRKHMPATVTRELPVRPRTRLSEKAPLKSIPSSWEVSRLMPRETATIAAASQASLSARQLFIKLFLPLLYDEATFWLSRTPSGK